MQNFRILKPRLSLATASCSRDTARATLAIQKASLASQAATSNNSNNSKQQQQARRNQSTTAKNLASAKSLELSQEELDDAEQPQSQPNFGAQSLRVHEFARRHLGPSDSEIGEMLAELKCESLDKLVEDTVPEDILLTRRLQLPAALTEQQLVDELRQIAAKNEAHEWKTYIGLGYYNNHTPAVILRQMFENPAWTSAYTAYQPEISQGRLESLMNFQTLVTDMTRLDVANASLLDEGSAAAEAMQICVRLKAQPKANGSHKFLVSKHCNPQTISVLRTRASGLSVGVELFDELAGVTSSEGLLAGNSRDLRQYAGCLVQYPNAEGLLVDLDELGVELDRAKCPLAVASDLLALALFKPPGDFSHKPAICIGSCQRLGVPLNFGGPAAAYMAVDKKLIRLMPGRIVGATRDSQGQLAYRFALQTREQHIRRERATSNICTSQALLANITAMFAVYHGAEGLREIAESIHVKTALLSELVSASGGNYELVNKNNFFDTLTVKCDSQDSLRALKDRAEEAKINLRYYNTEASRKDSLKVSMALDETTKLQDVFALAKLFNSNNDDNTQKYSRGSLKLPLNSSLSHLKRGSSYLDAPVFKNHQSEAQLVRYMRKLELKDISLANSMIPLGSCTMKLNGTSEMLASSWPEFNACHPLVPTKQVQGYMQLLTDLNKYLCEITGYDRISFQPNSGAQGEYAGLRAIKAYLDSLGQDKKRDVCLIPVSAHGTNPASAQMAGLNVVQVKVRAESGGIDMQDLREKVDKHASRLACLMITYPSTFGIFEGDVRQVCDLIHSAGGQVYLDGANLNAQVGVCRPGDLGADVSHLNLHKTFCIPHGGGGPGAGPIGVKSHLAPFLPSHTLTPDEFDQHDGEGGITSGTFGSVSSAMFGSPAILPISWSYIRLMGDKLKKATQVAILNANYMRQRLEGAYDILYRGDKGNVAHEFILDCRGFKKTANVEAIDIAKRLQDFSLHSATVSWPVSNTLMLEPTESEDKQQLDRYCNALLILRQEIQDIADGKLDRDDNPLKNAPHCQAAVCSSQWTHCYSREQAAFPAYFITPATKVWPSVGRVDDTYGDTNLFCSCPPIDKVP